MNAVKVTLIVLQKNSGGKCALETHEIPSREMSAREIMSQVHKMYMENSYCHGYHWEEHGRGASGCMFISKDVEEEFYRLRQG